jgi:hypothetical protein
MQMVKLVWSDETITIPAVSVTSFGNPYCTKCKASVNVKQQQFTIRKFRWDFDNGIIAHEYGHGISTRLAGGANNSSCLDNGSNGRRMVRLVCFDDAIKTWGRWNNNKEVLELLFLHKLTWFRD